MAGEIVADGDRELLELAAKAAGIELDWDIPENSTTPWRMTGEGDERGPAAEWNPLTDDGDALRLAVKLRLDVIHNDQQDNDAWVMVDNLECVEDVDGESSRDAATRRAIVRAAAEIGKQKGGAA